MDKITLDKTVETTIILIFLCVFTAVGHAVGTSIYTQNSAAFFILFTDGIVGMAILALISLLGFVVGQVPGFKKMPVILWVSLIAGYVSSPYFPLHKILVELTERVSLLAICTPVLAYAGLALGKDIMQFKAISWRIIPVALAVFTGTFLFAAIIAQFTLRWEGVIP